MRDHTEHVLLPRAGDSKEGVGDAVLVRVCALGPPRRGGES